ncbi:MULTISPECIES: hypothetical protein [unclassified Moorena]|nr:MULTISPECIES: hypothetical protein [unclassified Moorena]NEO18243.1 hypothetical protein [Moorena sp. SIO4A5]NEQ60249.1 hypothetical protein [Moorena sp. SIO4A1]
MDQLSHSQVSYPDGARSGFALKKRGVAPLPTPDSQLPIPYLKIYYP